MNEPRKRELMTVNGLLIARSQEWLPQDQIERLPHGIRGVYILYEYRGSTESNDVVYIGMARRGARGRQSGRIGGRTKVGPFRAAK